MSSTPQQMIIEAFAQLAAYQPQSASEMARHLEADHEMWSQIAQSYTTLADRAQSEMPYGPATADGLRDVGAAAGSVGQLAQNLHQVFRSEHEVEIGRIENPRPDEKQWDTGAQS